MASGPGIYLATGLTVLLSLLAGGALCSWDRRGWSWLAPGCGFAVVMAVAWIGVRLPGDGVTAALLLLGVGVAGAVRLRGRVEWRSLLVGLPTAALVLAATALPFLANRRFGALGRHRERRLALHLEFADILALGDSAPANVDVAYPVGPHSVVAAISDALGVSIESAFVGVIIAVPVLTALTALAALEHAPRRAQPLGAALVGLSYLSAAFFIQASFKETVIASLVLTFTLVMREVARDRFLWRRWVVPIIALVFAGLAAFSVPALFWIVGIGVAVTVVVMVTQRIRPDIRVALGALGLVVALAATIAIFETLTSFFELGPGRFVLTASEGGRGGGSGGSGGGNLFGPLSFFEALGIWPSSDFRLQPGRDGWELQVAFACLATVVGLALTVARREWVLLTGMVFTVLTYLLVAEFSLAYNAAKALVIATPLIAMVTMAGLLTPVRRALPALLLAVLTGVFVVGAAQSTVLPLKSGIVRPSAQEEALSEMRAAVAGKPTLFLGRENYAAWELRSTKIAYLGVGARAVSFGFRPQQGAIANRDIDSLLPTELERVDLVVAPNTLFQSFPGPDFREVRRNRWYKLYRREHPSAPRFVLNEGDEPGDKLRCSTTGGRETLRLGGRAFVRPEPVIGPVDEWIFPGGDNRRPAPRSRSSATAKGSTRRSTCRPAAGRYRSPGRARSRSTRRSAGAPSSCRPTSATASGTGA